MRSRTILSPKGTDTRPTMDRTRESLFNILAGECPGARVLDLYAGSGALALEALSRGAEMAVMSDLSREAARVIKANIASLRVEDRARFLPMSDMQAVLQLKRGKEEFDLVFLDPPYRLSTDPACKALADAGVLAENALIVVEHAANVQPAPDVRFKQTDQRKYRDTMITFYRYQSQGEESENGGSMDLSGQL